MEILGGLKAKTADASKNVGPVKFHLIDLCRIENPRVRGHPWSFVTSIAHKSWFISLDLGLAVLFFLCGHDSPPSGENALGNLDLGLALTNFIWLTY